MSKTGKGMGHAHKPRRSGAFETTRHFPKLPGLTVDLNCKRHSQRILICPDMTDKLLQGQGHGAKAEP